MDEGKGYRDAKSTIQFILPCLMHELHPACNTTVYSSTSIMFFLTKVKMITCLHLLVNK